MDVERTMLSRNDSGGIVEALQVDRWLGVLWGKSAKFAGGRRNLLLQHLFDTAAVAELIWDHFLAESVCRRVAGLVGGELEEGRRFFVWLCGIHDWGKATPAFQCVDADGADAVWRAGLRWDRIAVSKHKWRHDKAGAAVAFDLLVELGWSAQQRDWVWPVIAGHHARFPTLGELGAPRRAEAKLRGSADWRCAQRALVQTFTTELGFSAVEQVAPAAVPNRALQLQLSGFVVMADWIASGKTHFSGIDQLVDVGMDTARGRAAVAWQELGLRRGWGSLPEPSAVDFERRFGVRPRPSQCATLGSASHISSPGLMIVEAPMGEGKTKAALFAAEILAARFGMDGVFVGMPTQATCDPMFSEVRRWLSALEPDLADQVALLHGKRRFNEEWQQLLAGRGDPDADYRSVGEDEFGLDDPYVNDVCEGESPERSGPAEWFLGRNRGLLAPFVVGTVDQLLVAATRTKHVMLRMAGLAGKVVIIDEVHAADIYMSQFLEEGLRWLGQAGVPVVLLSATLTPCQRRDLTEAYLAGARGAEDAGAYDLAAVAGYPRITTACTSVDGDAHVEVETAPAHRGTDLAVKVEVVPEHDDSSEVAADLSQLLHERLADGGCALFIRNTVGRAQSTYEQLRTTFGDDVQLLHARMHARHRADRSSRYLDLLGPPGGGRARPPRLILVATQLAEQSFDIDADLLVTDLAPMDLLLQRIGRMHRHTGVARPAQLQTPSVVVTGFAPQTSGAPTIVEGCESIYGRWPLLRSAAAIALNRHGRWAIPSDVCDLVEQAYAYEGEVPAGWESATAEAFNAWRCEQRSRADAATRYLLTRFGEHARPTLAGLHRMDAAEVADDQIFVRDGDKTVEVVLVRYDGRGYRSMTGRWLGVHGEASPDLVDDVLGGTIRLPAALTKPVSSDSRPLEGWRADPWLRYSRALVLGKGDIATVGSRTVRYDDALGLVVS